MVTATQKDNRVVTGEVRLSYVHVFEPYANDPDQAPKYSTVLIIPKSDKATLNAIRKAAAHAAENGKAKFGGKVPAPIQKNPATTLHDGDEEADLERNPEYEGCYYMSVSSKVQPGIIDRNKMPILDQQEVYSGCYARVALGAFAYNTSGNKGVSFGLNHVQKLRDGEPLGGITRAEDEFDDLDDMDDEGDDLI
jgi:hypothetical protein